MPILTRTCQGCGKSFAWDSASKTVGRYCTLACYRASSNGTLRHVCETCGRGFNAFRSRPNPRYCSAACAPNRLQCEMRNCEECGREFQVTPHTGRYRKTCSRACSAARASARAPERNERTRFRSKSWTRVREHVLRRDGNKCTKCGAAGPRLQAHHRIPWVFLPEDTPELLTTLCERCHRREDAKGVDLVELARVRYDRATAIDRFAAATAEVAESLRAVATISGHTARALERLVAK